MTDQNLWLAMGYNVIVIPLAAGALYPFTPSLEVAALSMSGSTVLVGINTPVLKHVNLADIARHRSTQTSQLHPVEAPA